MSEANWLYDENGEMHRGLYSCGPETIARLAAEIDAEPQRGAPRIASEMPVTQGDELLLHPVFRKTWRADWIRVVRVKRPYGMGVSYLCQGPDGQGGFARADMFVGWRRADEAIGDYVYPDGARAPRQP